MRDLERRLGKLEGMSGQKEGGFAVIYAPVLEDEAAQRAAIDERKEAYYRNNPDVNVDGTFFLVIIPPHKDRKGAD